MLAALAVLAMYGWWATGLRPFTAPALVVTLATGGVNGRNPVAHQP
ncbi:MAG TPA: hypothetical protein VHL54_03195 [Actinomycetota bacterium]|nr:hypothetical protein [Actinomycetota bacterium]